MSEIFNSVIRQQSAIDKRLKWQEAIERNRRNQDNWKASISADMAWPCVRAVWPLSSINYVSGQNPQVMDVAGGAHHLYNDGVLFGYDPTSIDGLVPIGYFQNAGSTYIYRADAGGANWADITGTEAYVIPTQNGLTVKGWFYFESVGALRGLMSKWGVTGASGAYMLYLNAANAVEFITEDGAGANATVTGIVPTTGVWHYIVGRFDPNAPSVDLWMNETHYTAVSGITSIADNAIQFEIGAWTTAGSYHDGFASLCVLSAAAVSDAEIIATYQQQRGLFGV